jgi:hypothetical protein
MRRVNLTALAAGGVRLAVVERDIDAASAWRDAAIWAGIFAIACGWTERLTSRA